MNNGAIFFEVQGSTSSILELCKKVRVHTQDTFRNIHAHMKIDSKLLLNLTIMNTVTFFAIKQNSVSCKKKKYEHNHIKFNSFID